MSSQNLTILLSDPAYVNANQNAPILKNVIIWSILSTIALALRLTAKIVRQSGLGIDDALLVISYIFCIGQSAMVAAALNFGLGRHFITVSLEDNISFAKAYFAGTLLQPTTLTAAKLSVLVLLHRIFIIRGFQITARILGLILLLWFVANQLCELLICRPISSQWNPQTPGHCGNQHIFTCIISVLRYVQLYKTIKDVTYDSPGIAIWQIVEANVTLICACMIAARPAMSYLYPQKLISRTWLAWSQYASLKIDTKTDSRQEQKPDLNNPFGSVTILRQRGDSASNHADSSRENCHFELRPVKNDLEASVQYVSRNEIAPTNSGSLK
ncbi:hypothetical protein BofuT4_P108880.1 [Botrytis cinerea T4]|uniref:Rhodopsin domain-containing protein n=1 Tax=Botryotinia fuckeliana (strain T4) TaxID=999810 RepID=G2Y7A2_BOTF4|nr:hypothetical protein BofuT4_P108880.1 [Botrytis cinerea T4]